MKAKGGRFQGRVLGRSNNNANVNAGVAYSNTNNASSNSNTNNGGRLCLIHTLLLTGVFTQLKYNRLYGDRLRVSQQQWARNLSLGNSNHSSVERTGKYWKAGTSQSAADYGQVDWKQAESAMAAKLKKQTRGRYGKKIRLFDPKDY